MDVDDIGYNHNVVDDEERNNNHNHLEVANDDHRQMIMVKTNSLSSRS